MVYCRETFTSLYCKYKCNIMPAYVDGVCSDNDVCSLIGEKYDNLHMCRTRWSKTKYSNNCSIILNSMTGLSIFQKE